MWNEHDPEPKWGKKSSKKELENNLVVPLWEFKSVLSEVAKERSNKREWNNEIQNRRNN